VILADDLYIVGQAGTGGFNDGSCKIFVNGLIKSDAINVNDLMKLSSIHTDEFQLGWGNAYFSSRNSTNSTLQIFQGLPLIFNPADLNRVGIGIINPRERLEVQGNIVANGERGATTFRSTYAVCTGRIDCNLVAASYRIFATDNVFINGFPALIIIVVLLNVMVEDR